MCGMHTEQIFMQGRILAELGKLFFRNSLHMMEHQLNEHKVGLLVNHLRFQLTNLESGSKHVCNQSQSFQLNYIPPFRSLHITDYFRCMTLHNIGSTRSVVNEVKQKKW